MRKSFCSFRAATGCALRCALRVFAVDAWLGVVRSVYRYTRGASKPAAHWLLVCYAHTVALFHLRRWPRRFVYCSVTAVVVFLGEAEWTVQRTAGQRIHDSADGLPSSDVALVLGTARSLGNGVANLYYAPRLDTAAELYRLGKVRGIIVSGDNSRADYSEPDDMKADLVARGVPARFITCDYAGFSTRDSMQRVSRVFGQSRVIVVSQRFHLERALYLAQADGLEVTGCVAAGVPLRWQIRVRLREVLARGKAVLDVALGRGPKFLGPRELVLLAGADVPPACRQTGVQ